MTHRYWCFTINNPTDVPVFAPIPMQYLGWAPQLAPTTGTPHLQGYVQFKKPKPRRDVVVALADGGAAHVLKADGNGGQARDYYAVDEKKTNTGPVVEHGVLDRAAVNVAGVQGLRSDLKEFMARVKGGVPRSLLMAEMPDVFAKYQSWCSQVFQDSDIGEREEVKWPVLLPWCTIEKPDPAIKQRHVWLWGAPDSRKTYLTQTAFAGKRVFMAGSNSKYRFEGYENEDVIVFDDTIPSLAELLDCTNTWALAKQRIGGQRYTRGYWKTGHSRTIIIISNDPPTGWPPSFYARFRVIQVHGGAAAPPPPPESPAAPGVGVLPPLRSLEDEEYDARTSNGWAQ